MKYLDIIEEIKKFAEEIRIDVKYLLGERYESYLWLASAESLLENIVFDVGGWLSLPSVESLPSNTIFIVNEKIYFPIDHKVKVVWN